MVQLRVLIVSSVVPRPTSGGELLLDRHLMHDSRLELALVNEDPWSGPQPAILAAPNRILRHLRPAVIQETFRSLLKDSNRMYPRGDLAKFARCFEPNLVLTVAHGQLFPYAALLAKDLACPLVSLFHDWWPALIPAENAKSEERLFRRLYVSSQLVFSVSQAILDLLGPHPHAEVLLPIPGAAQAKPTHSMKSYGPLKVVYAGRLSEPYEESMRALTECLRKHDRISLTLFGDASGWPIDLIKDLTQTGVYKGERPPNDDSLEKSIQEADVLLAHLSFAAGDALRVRTSFPSKLTDYFRRGKPVVLWGPRDSAAVEWSRVNNAALVVDERSPLKLVEALEELANDELARKELSEAAVRIAATVSAEKLQEQFVAGLFEAARLRSSFVN